MEATTNERIFCMGNPLLDISIECQDDALLKKYDLTNGAAILAEEKHMPIFDEVFNMEGMQKVTGGAALNTARSTAYALKMMGVAESKTDYYGSIGNDERGKNLETLCTEAGVTTNFHVSEDKPTGCCAVVIYNKERTLTTDLAAACAYQESHFDANMDTVKKAKFIYTTGYFITSSMPTLLKAAAYANENDVPFGFNFSAVFLQFIEKDNMLKAIEAADFIFANEDEGAQFAKTAEMPEGSDLKDVAKKLATWKKTNSKRPRYAIITYGPKPVIVAKHTPGEGDESCEVKEYPVPQLTDEQLIDTNGCGDSFAGGFLAAYYKNQTVEECIGAGIKLSSAVVQHVGCSFPDKVEF